MSPQNTESGGNLGLGRKPQEETINYSFANSFLRRILTSSRAAFIFTTLSSEGDPEKEREFYGLRLSWS